ncbi:hypothetical protein FNV43_RR11744 [Rhamnella rubrinervis]|uniref:QWRF motif-containing protein 2 n=1 Tax=Rhamnella rubrinervis TaxID=2594499 RepID=A0A8K0H6R8_9ROSA|nr:hypothetical protein FNV43_RR11744 [Rhamnella rubrinervis]
MVAAVSTTTFNHKIASQRKGPQNPTRPPLLPSDPDNALAPRPSSKPREVTSRYMSSSSSSASSTGSRRCSSPLVSRTATVTPRQPAVPVTKRSQSVDKRRPVTARPNSLDLRSSNNGGGEMSAAQKLLFTSTRSLSVSFQGESFSFHVSKVKPAPASSPSLRKGTPERRKVTTPARGDQSENLKLTEQQRWPGRLRQANCMNRSMDCTDERKSANGSRGSIVRELQKDIADDGSHTDGRLSSGSGNAESVKGSEPVVSGNSAIRSDAQSDPVVSSDSDSVSSGSTSSGAQEFVGDGGFVHGQRGPRGIMVPARFWQETNNRLRRQQEPVSPWSKSTGAKALATSGFVTPKKLSMDSPVLSPRGVLNTRAQLSPIRGVSPSKPSRGVTPSRARHAAAGTPSSNTNIVPSILSFAADLRRGKGGENRIVDAHVLRILYNRLLQWRFINARADAALAAQRLNAERSLYNAWITTLKLRESVRARRTELQHMKQTLKLASILKGHVVFLEEWSLVDQDYSSSLSGATEALRASTLRLPVVCGARADVQNVKDAICSAVDVMQAMASSICLLSSKVGEVNSLVAELANVTAMEQALLGQCKDLLSTVAALQVKECSFRTHVIELRRRPSSLIAEV